jgi:TonB family protein
MLTILITWSEQVFVVTAAALAALTLTHSKTRLWIWQALLLVMLLLPAIEPWSTPPAQVELTAVKTGAMPAFQIAAAPRWHWRAEDWLWIIAAGAALRLMWVAAGFLRLRRYRKQATPLAEPPLRFTSNAAKWYASDSVPGPVTYGWRRPVILLPARVLELPADLREAIECHELIHVRRGDWLVVLAEALVRSLFWFHPAIWFVLNRIQLAREQVVDQEAVGLLQNRERYLDALVAVAGYRLQPDLAPAPLFLRKRHLAARVAAVIREVNMSRSRIAAGVVTMCSAVAIAAFAAMWMFPFVSQAQTAPDSPGVTVDAGGTLLHRAPVRVPASFTASGVVTVQATLDAKGEVSDARVVSGPDELRKESLSSVLQWHYRPGPSQAMITIRVAGAATSAGAVAVAVPAAPIRRLPLSAPQPGTIKSIEFQGISDEAERELRGRLGIHEGDTVSQADLQKLNGEVEAFDSHMGLTASSVGVSGGAASEYNVGVRVMPESSRAVPAPLAVAGDDGPLPNGAQRLSSDIMASKLLSHPTPAYPAIAKSARIQGSVVLQEIVGTDGAVQNLKVVSAASPLLVQSAMDAVKQWVYQPTLLNGSPVPVLTTVTVNFSLQ